MTLLYLKLNDSRPTPNCFKLTEYIFLKQGKKYVFLTQIQNNRPPNFISCGLTETQLSLLDQVNSLHQLNNIYRLERRLTLHNYLASELCPRQSINSLNTYKMTCA